jgi:hypothetical protein
MKKPLSLEQLETRLVPTSFDWSGGLFNQMWSRANNWWDESTNAWATRAPGSQPGDIVKITNSFGTNNNCTLDAAPANPIDSLQLSNSRYLYMSADLHINGAGSISTISGYSGIVPGWSTLWLDGNYCQVARGSLGSGLPNGGGGTINVNGGTLEFDGDGAGNDINLWAGINVGTGSASGSILKLSNTTSRIIAHKDPDTGSYAQVTVGVNGTVDVTANNTGGWNIGPETNTTVTACQNSGVWKVENSSQYYFGEPVWQSAGSFTIKQGGNIKLDNFSGVHGGTNGTRGHSMFMTGGTVELQGDANPSDATGVLDVAHGLQMDSGLILCSATATQGTGAYVWNITSEHGGSEILLNGGTVQIGTGGSCGTLKYAGPDPNATAVTWGQGQIIFTESRINNDILCG